MNTLSRYLNSFKCYQQLPQETVQLLVSKAKKGDRSAASQIICSHQKFIIFTAKKFGFIHSNISEQALEDIISAGNVGLIEAINRYDSTKGAPFLSCAEFGIRNALGQNAHESKGGVYLPFAKAKKLSVLKKQLAASDYSNSSEKTLECFAEKTGKSFEEVKEILSWDYQESSLEGYTESSQNPVDEFSYNHTEQITDQIIKTEIQETTAKALSGLTEKQRFIITTHFGINCEKKSLTEIGQILNLTKQRVAQIEKDGFKILKNSEYAEKLQTLVA